MLITNFSGQSQTEFVILCNSNHYAIGFSVEFSKILKFTNPRITMTIPKKRSRGDLPIKTYEKYLLSTYKTIMRNLIFKIAMLTYSK